MCKDDEYEDELAKKIVENWCEDGYMYDPLPVGWDEIEKQGRWERINNGEVERLQDLLDEAQKEIQELRKGTRKAPLNTPNIIYRKEPSPRGQK